MPTLPAIPLAEDMTTMIQAAAVLAPADGGSYTTYPAGHSRTRKVDWGFVLRSDPCHKDLHLLLILYYLK